MRVAIVGAGGVGGYLGVRLNQSGLDVIWLARGRSLAHLREIGIALRNPLGDVTLGPQQASDSPEALGRADLVIVTVKLYDLGDLAPRLRPLLGPSTAVLPLQNGVEAYAMLAAFHDELWERTGIARGRTVLGGFSMGSVMSYALGLGADRPAPARSASRRSFPWPT